MKIKRIKRIPTAQLHESLERANLVMSLGMTPEGRKISSQLKGEIQDGIAQIKKELRRRGEPDDCNQES